MYNFANVDNKMINNLWDTLTSDRLSQGVMVDTLLIKSWTMTAKINDKWCCDNGHWHRNVGIDRTDFDALYSDIGLVICFISKPNACTLSAHTRSQACNKRLQRLRQRNGRHKLFPRRRQLWAPDDLHEETGLQPVLYLHQQIGTLIKRIRSLARTCNA